MPSPSRAAVSSPRLLALVLLVLPVLVAFWPVLDHEFVNLDDDKFVTQNPYVPLGLSATSIRWSFAIGWLANWMPLTWMSYMLDWELYGPAPAGHHATSLVLHVVNTLLLWLLLDRMTGAPWRSALAAALFGLHPLHVESVAWVAERKDVLSTCFWFLTTLAYVAYVRRSGALRYLWVVLGLALGLLSKPMLVTLPFTLLLLDYWPLARLQAAAGKGSTPWQLVREKLPLVPLVVASCVVTVIAQHRAGAMAPLEQYPLAVRAGNAVVTYVAYLWKMLWPRDLAVFYPHPGGVSPVQATVCAALLLIVTVAAIRLRARRPYLLVGWLWYLGTLVPVIGLVQVGAQAMADRYTYVPLIGIFVALAWLLPAAPSWRFVPAAAVAVLLALALQTRAQVGYWRDSITLFSHALAVEEQNPLAHTSLASALAAQGETGPAIAHFERALALAPHYVAARLELGTTLLKANRTEDAIREYTTALQFDPTSVRGLTNLGNALLRQGRADEAIPWLQQALTLDPDFALAHVDLGRAFARQARPAEARAQFEQALRVDPRNFDALHFLGQMLIAEGRPAEGVEYLDRAIAVHADFGRAHVSRAVGLFQLGRYAEAWAAIGHARAHGTEPPEALLHLLAERMPEPRS